LCVLGALLERNEQAVLAEQSYAFAAKSNTKSAMLLFRLGALYVIQNRIEEATEAFSEAVNTDPEDADALRYFTGHLVGLGL
jgi:tetratricopeptide (TPR) repeat protein